MSVITAIFQAILQAISFILPISESGHSSIFHYFAFREAGTCSALTGIVHIGIAIGIIFAMLGAFLSLFKEFFGTLADVFKKRLKGARVSPARSFMYMTLISFVPMLVWLIPAGSNGLLYNVFRKTGFNGTLIDDGLFIILTGLLVILCAKQISLSRNKKPVTVLPAIIVGILSLFLVPVSGLSLVAGTLTVLVLFGVSERLALRYSLVISVPVLVVMGIVEICVSVTKATIIQIIIGIIVSAVVSFFCAKVLKWIVTSAKLKYFGIYDIGVGVITFVIGIFELILKK